MAVLRFDFSLIPFLCAVGFGQFNGGRTTNGEVSTLGWGTVAIAGQPPARRGVAAYVFDSAPGARTISGLEAFTQKTGLTGLTLGTWNSNGTQSGVPNLAIVCGPLMSRNSSHRHVEATIPLRCEARRQPLPAKAVRAALRQVAAQTLSAETSESSGCNGEASNLAKTPEELSYFLLDMVREN